MLADQHSPWAQFLIVHWPLILVAILAPLAGRYRGLALRFAAIFIPLLIATELLNAFDGAYGGEFIRFNPALKWWGWIFTGGFLAISTCLLASERRLVRWAGIGSLLLVSTFAADLAAYLVFQPKPYVAQLDGEGFYTADLANARMMIYLKNAEDGLVLENVYDERPKDTGIYGSFSGKPDLLGVPWILQVLNNRLTELPPLESEYQPVLPRDTSRTAGFSDRLPHPLCRLVGAREHRYGRLDENRPRHRIGLRLDGVLEHRRTPCWCLGQALNATYLRPQDFPARISRSERAASSDGRADHRRHRAWRRGNNASASAPSAPGFPLLPARE